MKEILRLVAAGLCALLMASCSGPESKARNEFVDDCRTQGGQEGQCVCVYDKLSSYYGALVMSKMQHEGLPADDFGEAVIAAAVQCKAGDSSSKLVLSAQSGAGSAAQQPEPKAPNQDDVERLIASHAKDASGAEYRDSRQVKTGDATGDGIPDQVALFTIEVASDNTATQYLAVLAGSNGVHPFATDAIVVGGAGQHVEGLNIEDGEVKLEVLSLGPDDPDCCPSTRSVVEYLWHNGKLKRVD